MAAPKIKTRRRNECLDLGSENVTISRDLLFLTVRQAIKTALLDGKKYKPNDPDEVIQTDAQGRASKAVDELLHRGGRPS